MKLYIKDFKMGYSLFRKVPYIKFSYFDCYRWKSRKLKGVSSNMLSGYTGAILDDVEGIVGGKGSESEIKANLRQYNIELSILEQLNSEMFKGKTKLFR